MIDKAKSLSYGTLLKMQKGEIPVTQEAEQLLAEYNQQLQQNDNLCRLFKVPLPIPNEVQALTAKQESITIHTSEQLLAVVADLTEVFKRFEQKLQAVDHTSKEVYENESDFYYKQFGLRLPYQQFWDWFWGERYADREVAWIINHFSYETIIEDFNDFISYNCHKRIARQEATLKNLISPPAIQQSIKAIDNATNKPRYQQLEDLFQDSHALNKCVQALRQIEQPVINQQGEWIGKRGSKSILVAWIERLEDCGFIRRLANRKELVVLLNAYFPNLNMGADARTFGEKNFSYDQAKADFAALILH